MKTLLFYFFLFFLSVELQADYLGGEDLLRYSKEYNISDQTNNSTDVYDFFYVPDQYKCELKKNGKVIEMFDKRFTFKKPKVRGYKCPSWIKEKYTDCRITKNSNTGATTLGFGKYERTNLLFAFNPLYDNIKANIQIKCKR